MQEHDKAWAFYVFSSANALRTYSHRATRRAGRLLGLAGPGRRGQPVRQAPRHRHRWPWCGNCRRTASACWARRSSAWRTTRPENIDEAIDYAVAPRHRLPPVHALHAAARHAAARRALGPGPDAGRERVPSLPTCTGSTSSTTGIRTSATARRRSYLLQAFQRDFDRNGPSVVRIVRTMLAGWQRYKHHPDARIRRRLTTGGRRSCSDLRRRRCRRKEVLPASSAAEGQDVNLARRSRAGVRPKDTALQRFRADVTCSKRSATKNNASQRAGLTSRPRSTTPTTRLWPCRTTESHPACARYVEPQLPEPAVDERLPLRAGPAE